MEKISIYMLEHIFILQTYCLIKDQINFYNNTIYIYLYMKTVIFTINDYKA